MAGVEGHASPAGIIGTLKMCRASVLLVLDLQGAVPVDEWQNLFTLVVPHASFRLHHCLKVLSGSLIDSIASKKRPDLRGPT